MGNSPSKTKIFKEFLEERVLVSIDPPPEIKVIKTRCRKPIEASLFGDSKEMKHASSWIEANKKALNLNDQRKQVFRVREWPYCAHGIVSVKMDDIHYWGTGTLIGPNIVLTAGYNIYSHRDKAYSNLERMRFIIPGNNGESLFSSVEVEQCFVSPNYINDEKREDYGILILKESIGNETGYFGLACLEPEELKSKRIHITGYLADKVALKPNTYGLWEMKGEVENIDPNQGYIDYLIDAGPGQGGSGVWYQEGEDFYVCGVHLSGGQFTNRATLLTRAIYEQISRWLQQAESREFFLKLENKTSLNLLRIQVNAESMSSPSRYNLGELTSPNPQNKHFGGKEAKAFAQNTPWKKLLELHLSSNNISTKGVKALARNISWIHLSILDLSNNKIDGKGARELAKNISWKNLSSLDLRSNKIGDRGARELAKNISWKNLSSLDLRSNKIGDRGAKELAKNTSWIHLSNLNLSKNHIHGEAAKALTTNAFWTTIKALNLSSNKIHAKDAKLLQERASYLKF